MNTQRLKQACREYLDLHADIEQKNARFIELGEAIRKDALGRGLQITDAKLPLYASLLTGDEAKNQRFNEPAPLKLDGRTKEARALKAKLADTRAKTGIEFTGIDGRTKEGRALKEAILSGKAVPPVKRAAPAKRASTPKPSPSAKKASLEDLVLSTLKYDYASSRKIVKEILKARPRVDASQIREALRHLSAQGRARSRERNKSLEWMAIPKSTSLRVAEGRRAVSRGDRPPMKEALALVLGDKEMEVGEVLSALEQKGWLPNTSDPRPYVNAFLANERAFERVARGKYKVREGFLTSHGTTKAVPLGTSSERAEEAVREFMASKDSGDGGIVPNPFSV